MVWQGLEWYEKTNDSDGVKFNVAESDDRGAGFRIATEASATRVDLAHAGGVAIPDGIQYAH